MSQQLIRRCPKNPRFSELVRTGKTALALVTTMPLNLGWQTETMTSVLYYLGAALAEIAGCFTFWAWLRLSKSSFWLVPGLASLVAFAGLLTRIESELRWRLHRCVAGLAVGDRTAAARSLGCAGRRGLSHGRGDYPLGATLYRIVERACAVRTGFRRAGGGKRDYRDADCLTPKISPLL